MPLIESESLVLKTYNLAEADRIVVFFTRDHGVVRGVARGAKRLKSRFGSTLEPFSTVELTYFQKEDRELVSIQSIELLRSYFEQAAKPAFLETFSYIADLLLQFTPPNDPNETLFRMIRACLSAASDNENGFASIRLYFELWLLRLGGFLPDWSRCEDCKTPFVPQEVASLRSGFHLHCQRCRALERRALVTPEYREMYKNIQRLSPAEFIEFGIGRESVISDLSDVMKRLIAQILESEPIQNRKVPEIGRKNADLAESFQEYLVGAVLPYFVFSWLLLSVILFVQQASRFSDIFFSVNIPSQLIWQLTFALVPNVIAFTCPMAALVGVIIGLSKMQSDSELTAIRAAGVGNLQITMPIGLIGILLSLFAFSINLYGVPLAARIVRQVAMQTAIYKLESPIEPGVFNTEVAGFTIYVRDGDISDGTLEKHLYLQ